MARCLGLIHAEEQGKTLAAGVRRGSARNQGPTRGDRGWLLRDGVPGIPGALGLSLAWPCVLLYVLTGLLHQWAAWDIPSILCCSEMQPHPHLVFNFLRRSTGHCQD